MDWGAVVHGLLLSINTVRLNLVDPTLSRSKLTSVKTRADVEREDSLSCGEIFMSVLNDIYLQTVCLALYVLTRVNLRV